MSDPLPAIDLAAYIDSFLADARAAFPAIRHATAHASLPVPTPVPAVLLELVDATADGDIGTDQQPFKLRFDLRVVTSPKGGAPAAIAARVLALNIAASLKNKTFGHPTSPLIILGVYPDYIATGGDNTSGARNASYIECQRITCETSALIGANTWHWPEETLTLEWGDGHVTDEYLAT